jgi:CheY-like chemotaxis protein
MKMKKILIVDDNFENRRLIERKLNQWGVEFSMARNGEEALRATQSGTFDLILMDINLPRTDNDDPIDYLGIELSEEILSKAALPKPKIVAITAHGMDVQRKAILASGISSIIQKGREDYFKRILECLQANGIVGRQEQKDDPLGNRQVNAVMRDSVAVVTKAVAASGTSSETTAVVKEQVAAVGSGNLQTDDCIGSITESLSC